MIGIGTEELVLALAHFEHLRALGIRIIVLGLVVVDAANLLFEVAVFGLET